MHEMNPDVKCNFRDEDPSDTIEKEPDWFKQFTIVIATDFLHQNALHLESILHPLGIPFIVGRAYGLFGYCRTILDEHRMIETKTENRRHGIYTYIYICIKSSSYICI